MGIDEDAQVMHLRLKIEEEKKQAAKERAFKAAEDARWERIKKQRAEKKRLRGR